MWYVCVFVKIFDVSKQYNFKVEWEEIRKRSEIIKKKGNEIPFNICNYLHALFNCGFYFITFQYYVEHISILSFLKKEFLFFLNSLQEQL